MPILRTAGALNEAFAVPGIAAFEVGDGGLIRAVLTPPSVVAHVYLHGAHVTHHQVDGEPLLLFLSSRSRFEAGRAIRGGVPVVFPWFGPKTGDPTAPDHGFARTSDWSVESVEARDGAVTLVLGLEPSADTRRYWRPDFRVRQRVEIGATLAIALDVLNCSDAPFTFEEALHTYLRVGDVHDVSVTGLDGVTYIDRRDGMRRATLGPGPFAPRDATDRVFLDTRARCVVSDPRLGRRLSLEKTGSATTVVWNPWEDGAAALSDLGPGEWRSMLCVETANAADDAVTLAPGASSSMGVMIRAERP